MIFKFINQEAIFIHIPKTGGNYIQKIFQINRMSIDSFVKNSNNQDLINRFDVRGKFTDNKHQSLSDYCNKDCKFKNFNVFTSVRKPFERLVSLYFSPHRWVTYDQETGSYINPQNVEFNEDKFLEIVKKERPAWTMISLSRKKYIPPKKLVVIRNESLNKDINNIFKGLKHPKIKINHTFYRHNADIVLKNFRLRNLIENSEHGKDLKFFY